jgi:hypothetical protein
MERIDYKVDQGMNPRIFIQKPLLHPVSTPRPITQTKVSTPHLLNDRCLAALRF